MESAPLVRKMQDELLGDGEADEGDDDEDGDESCVVMPDGPPPRSNMHLVIMRTRPTTSSYKPIKTKVFAIVAPNFRLTTANF